MRLRRLTFSSLLIVATCGQAAAGSPNHSALSLVSAAGLGSTVLVQVSPLYCMALGVHFEGGSSGEPEEGLRLIASVINSRARANLSKWGGADVCDVVFHKRAGVCQFSFACLPPARRTPRDGMAWRNSLEIAQDELDGRSEAGDAAVSYYLNPILTGDRNACWFRKELVTILTAGRHEFFREPTSDERVDLARSTPIECERHREALEKARNMALKAARAARTRLGRLKQRLGRCIKSRGAGTCQRKA